MIEDIPLIEQPATAADDTYTRMFAHKLLARPETLDAITAGEYPYPVDWHLYPSNKCNHRCVWCMFRQPAAGDGPVEQIDFAVILPGGILLRAVADAARTGAALIHFSGGGEPLINKATPEAMALAQELAAQRPAGRRHALRVALSTNGRLLTPEVASQVDYIRVSLNAGTPEQHHATNHAGDPGDVGDWHVILDRIADAIPHRRGDIGLGFVVDHQNVQDIAPFCRVAAELGVDFVHIRPAFYYEPALDAAVRGAMPEAFRRCEEARAAYGERVRIFSIKEKFDGYWTPRSYSRCRAVLTGITLRATGEFAVCQDRPDLTFGTDPSYRAGAPFELVWGSPQHRRVVETIRAGGELDRCPRCVWGSRNKLIDSWERDDLRIALV